MRRVGHEFALRLERQREAVGHGVERTRDFLLLGRALHRSAGLEIASADAPGGRRELPERARERAGDEPGDGQAEDQRESADADEGVLVAAYLAIERVDALRDPDGADRAACLR